MYSLEGKIVCITGASSGIGAACARAFAGGGARLILSARRVERLRALAEALKAEHGAECHIVPLDVREAEAVRHAFEALPETWRAIDVLINNAGLALGKHKAHEATVDEIDVMVDTNVKGVFYVTKAVVPGMVARRHGHVIHLGSIAGEQVYPGGTAYCATKHAVRAINEGLKMDLHGTGVRVSSVDPGLVETDFSLVRFSGDAPRADAVYEGMTPLSAEDVADAVYYCATRPPHVNVTHVGMLPTDQSSSTMVYRRAEG